MPNFNGMGPNEAGAMTGRGLGRCNGGRSFDNAVAGIRGMGRGEGHGRGCGRGNGGGSRGNCGNRGMGNGMGMGRGLGWMAMGYGDETPQAVAKNALEARKAYLSAELERTEALLSQKVAASKLATDESGEA